MKPWVWIIVVAFAVYALLGEKSGRSNTAAVPPAPTFNQPALPLPLTGIMGVASLGNAPLRVQTRSDGFHYFVKVTPPSSNVAMTEMFIRSGDFVEVELPLGSYEIKYASGKTWYGPQWLFGPETSYSKADKVFNFTSDDYQISGYTVELFTQVGGNLHTSRIGAGQF